MTDIIRFQTFETYHNKKGVGSTKIRVHNLVKYWPEAELYKYGEKMDVMVFQKVYAHPDYDFPKTLDCIKILDICDPDWLEDMPVKETIDAMDAVTVPTETLKEFIEQMTDKPVRVIKDRFDLEEFPKTIKEHKGDAKSLVWFGYVHNAQTVKSAINAIIELGLKLTMIADKNPNVLAWAEGTKLKKEQYDFIQYDSQTINYELTKHDIAIFPQGLRPKDRFKSENKDIIANLCGLPVAKTREDLERLIDPAERNKEAKLKHAIAIKDYDCKISIREMESLINEIKSNRR